MQRAINTAIVAALSLTLWGFIAYRIHDAYTTPASQVYYGDDSRMVLKALIAQITNERAR